MKRLSTRWLHRQIAAASGEPLRVVRRLGFQLLSTPSADDRSSGWNAGDDRPPLVVDWDEADGRFRVGAQRLPRVA
ncbi:MAG TPA: hypothetical protein VGE52_13635 [Pirellulales bacterium]